MKWEGEVQVLNAINSPNVWTNDDWYYVLTGGFRSAHKAFSKTKRFEKKTWVVKKYLQSTLQVIEDMKETPESHTRKIVQMHTLAENFGRQLAKKVSELKCEDEFGQILMYQEIYLGKIVDNDEFITIEEFIPGSFVKFFNNTGIPCEDNENSENGMKAECLAHFSFEKSDQKLMLVDIQGYGVKLYDPEIASSELVEDGELLFCAGNLSKTAIDNFIVHHVCNKFCKLLQLSELKLI